MGHIIADGLPWAEGRLAKCLFAVERSTYWQLTGCAREVRIPAIISGFADRGAEEGLYGQSSAFYLASSILSVVHY